MNRSHTFLKHSYLKISPWKSKVQVMDGVKCQGNIVSPTSYWFISHFFHVNQTTYSWNAVFQNLTLKIQGQGHRWGQRSWSWSGSDLASIHTHPLCSMSMGPSSPEIWPNIQRRPGPIFCLLLWVSSGCAQPITGQVTSVTCPVIGWA